MVSQLPSDVLEVSSDDSDGDILNISSDDETDLVNHPEYIYILSDSDDDSSIVELVKL